MSDRNHGAVTHFNTTDDRRITIWRHTNSDGSNRYTFHENSVVFYPLPNDTALAQALGEEIYRLASEIGRLRRLEIEVARAQAKWGSTP